MPTFTDKVKRLERIRQALKRRYGDQPPVPVAHPVEYALRTILAEETTADAVEKAMDRLREYFVDWNDLRVSRPREIREVLGANFPRSGYKARVIPRLLDQVFKQHNSMVWDFLEAMGKVQARAYFEKLEDVRPFVAAALARDGVGAHAFPVDNDVARVLGRLAIVDPGAQSETDMQGFLERAVKSSRSYEVHGLVRRLGEELCLVTAPLCGKCPLRKSCPSASLAKRRAPREAKEPAASKKPAGKVARKKPARPRPKKKVRAGRPKAAPRKGGRSGRRK